VPVVLPVFEDVDEVDAVEVGDAVDDGVAERESEELEVTVVDGDGVFVNVFMTESNIAVGVL
jgi:hypothetical protein